MYFESDQHREQFFTLLNRFYKSPEYLSACYIVAIPEIYRITEKQINDTPIDWYWDIDERGNLKESVVVYKLSSGYRELARVSVEIFTGTSHFFKLPNMSYTPSKFCDKFTQRKSKPSSYSKAIRTCIN